jgi:hypothetical protein
MLLGSVIHSSVTYEIFEFRGSWPLKDPSSTNFLNDYIVFLSIPSGCKYFLWSPDFLEPCYFMKENHWL